ncbi:hypothetical protein ACTFIR_011855, partial [Dictyostelium discoideum]
RRLLFY